jgi:hypothetical protein
MLVMGHFSARPGPVKDSKTLNAKQIIAMQNIALQVGATTFLSKEFSLEKLLQEVARFNDRVRLPGLDDELNVEMLDGEKVRAFIDGLPGLEEQAIRQLAGRTLRLNFAVLRLHRFSCVTAEQLRAGYSLVHDSQSTNPQLANVRLLATISPALARARIQAARDAVARRDARLRSITAVKSASASVADLARIRQERRSAAMVWLALAHELTEQQPVASDVDELIEAARKALERESVAPQTGGMPP